MLEALQLAILELICFVMSLELIVYRCEQDALFRISGSERTYKLYVEYIYNRSQTIF